MSETMDVLVTGAHGTVGTAVREQLGDDPTYEFTYTDVIDADGVDTHVADMQDYETLRPAFDGRDAVIHLALNPELNWTVTDVVWTPELVENLAGTVNVFRAALDAGVERVVFASTNHVVGMYERELRPEIYESGHGVVVDRETTRPDSMYGVAKAFGETLGRFCAEFHGLRCYCLRLGGVLPSDRDHPYGAVERAVEAGDLERGSRTYERRAAHMKAMWLSRRDLGALIDRCLRDDDVEFDVFYGISDNANRWLDLERARAVLGYDPQDDGSEWSAPP